MQEVFDLIELSHTLFQKKLAVIEEQVKTERDPEKKLHLKTKAIRLFREYKQSLQEIEEYLAELQGRKETLKA